MAAARAALQPGLSADAAGLLGAYFQHLRGVEGAPAGAVASLVRMACASARLRRVAAAAAVPDAALAVALMEEKLAAAGGSPLFWPRWREELARCTDLAECLRCLAADLAAGLHRGGDGTGQCGGGRSADDWAARPEE